MLTKIFLLSFLFLFFLDHSFQAAPCCGPHGCVDVGSYDADPPQTSEPNDCYLPTDPNIYYAPTTVMQVRRWANMSSLIANGSSNGWALDPRFRTGCKVGGWCPYACNSPYIESQFDYLLGQPWTWEMSCSGTNVFLGSGRRVRKCPTDPIPANPSCGGGQNGLYCAPGGVPTVAAPSSTAPLSYKDLCLPSPYAVEIVNDTPWKITTCRTVFPGTEIPQIPTEVLPGQTVQLTTPQVQRADGTPLWWTAGGTTTVGLQFYFMKPQLAGKDCLTPVCQWIVTRPGITANSQGGIDYTPYIIEWVPSSIANQFTISVRMNTDVSVQPNSGYAGALGAPGYGLQLIDPSGNLQCDAWWSGPVSNPGAADNCDAICLGQGCANNQTCGSNCAQTLPNCNAPGMQCASTPVMPNMNQGDGTPFATGAGLSKACAVGSWDLDNPPSQPIKIRLYQYCDGGDCPPQWVGGVYVPPPARPPNPPGAPGVNYNGLPGTGSTQKLSGGAIGGIVVAFIVVLLLVAGVLVYFLVYKKGRMPRLIPQKTVEVIITAETETDITTPGGTKVIKTTTKEVDVVKPGGGISNKSFSFFKSISFFNKGSPNSENKYEYQKTESVRQEVKTNGQPPQLIAQRTSTTDVVVPIKPLPVAPAKSLPVAPAKSLSQAPINLTVGSTVMAKYSGDGKEYKAVIEDNQNGSYLVKYVDFGEDREWVLHSNVRKI